MTQVIWQQTIILKLKERFSQGLFRKKLDATTQNSWSESGFSHLHLSTNLFYSWVKISKSLTRHPFKIYNTIPPSLLKSWWTLERKWWIFRTRINWKLRFIKQTSRSTWSISSKTSNSSSSNLTQTQTERSNRWRRSTSWKWNHRKKLRCRISSFKLCQPVCTIKTQSQKLRQKRKFTNQSYTKSRRAMCLPIRETRSRRSSSSLWRSSTPQVQLKLAARPCAWSRM